LLNGPFNGQLILIFLKFSYGVVQGDDVRGAGGPQQCPAQRAQVLRDRVPLRKEKWVREKEINYYIYVVYIYLYILYYLSLACQISIRKERNICIERKQTHGQTHECFSIALVEMKNLFYQFEKYLSIDVIWPVTLSGFIPEDQNIKWF